MTWIPIRPCLILTHRRCGECANCQNHRRTIEWLAEEGDDWMPSVAPPRRSLLGRILCRLGIHRGREVHADGHGVAHGYTACARCGR